MVLQKHLVREANSGLDKIKVKLHYLTISASSFDGKSKESPFRYMKVGLNKGHTQKTYKMIGYTRSINKTHITVLYGKKENVKKAKKKTNIIICIAYPDPETLYELLNYLNNPKIRSIEYAIDFYCKSPQAVSNMFNILRRYLFFPYWTGKIGLKGGSYEHPWDRPDRNRVYFVENNSGRDVATEGEYFRKNSVKCYERGDTKSKKKDQAGVPYWERKDLNRVRFRELNKGDSCYLSKLGLINLADFIANPKFREMLLNRFSFSVFKGGEYIANPEDKTRLPREHEDYNAPDGTGNIECFMAECKRAIEEGKDPSKYRVNSNLMAPLMRKVQEAIKSAEEHWTAWSIGTGYAPEYYSQTPLNENKEFCKVA